MLGLQLGVQGILVLDARKGRLVLGDIITALNGKRVKTASDLYKLLDKCSIGDKIDMEVCHCACSIAWLWLVLTDITGGNGNSSVS